MSERLNPLPDEDINPSPDRAQLMHTHLAVGPPGSRQLPGPLEHLRRNADAHVTEDPGHLPRKKRVSMRKRRVSMRTKRVSMRKSVNMRKRRDE